MRQIKSYSIGCSSTSMTFMNKTETASLTLSDDMLILLDSWPKEKKGYRTWKKETRNFYPMKEN